MSKIGFGLVLVFALSCFTFPAYAQIDPEHELDDRWFPGESFALGSCFIDDPRSCTYALAEWLSQGQEEDYGIVASCNSCDPEPQAMGANNQPIYYCLTYGKKEVVTAGTINWVKVVDEGKLAWGS